MSPEPINIHPRKARFRRAISRQRDSLEGVIGRKFDERKRRQEEARWKPDQTALGFMQEMGFPEEWSKAFLNSITYYEPWLKERYEHLRCHFSRAGRLLLLLQRMSREDEADARQAVRERRRLSSERQQAQHIARWWKEDRQLAESDLMDVLRPIYPGQTDGYLLEQMKKWSLASRLEEHYRARRAIPK